MHTASEDSADSAAALHPAIMRNCRLLLGKCKGMILFPNHEEQTADNKTAPVPRFSDPEPRISPSPVDFQGPGLQGWEGGTTHTSPGKAVHFPPNLLEHLPSPACETRTYPVARNGDSFT